MKIALITENSQAAKNGIIHDALTAMPNRSATTCSITACTPPKTAHR